MALATLLELAKAINYACGSPMSGPLPQQLHRELEVITNGPADSAEVVWNALETPKQNPHESAECRAWRRLLTDEEKFRRLARDFAVGFPLIVPVTCEPRPDASSNSPTRGGPSAVPVVAQSAARAERRLATANRTNPGALDRPGKMLRLGGSSPRGTAKRPRTPFALEAAEAHRLARGAADVMKLGSERVHLHISAPGHSEGTALVDFRARPPVISRAGFATGMLTTIALMIAVLSHGILESNLEPAVTLLLLVPTALSIYVARPQEPIVTTSLLLGQRMLAAACGALAIVAATILVTGQTCRPGSEDVSCHQWTALPWLLIALAACAVMITVVLAGTLVYTARPPEKVGLEPRVN